ncbi:EamA family transporter RarD [Microbacterium capsulatum]|uniref:EamA family transporter RarD n=1 Tax=Microbacterium capsulatum TaxID=3041921 RepID=A0ABU0XBT6_9MICO|nr:EamA family transporter RarD [Microbacterium sp. ASV81]MDQ4212579.1 EamA family transporter RarD [Microbacterium sp. ASV81]
MPKSQGAAGVVSSLVASVLFGAIFYLYGVVDASAESQFGWRMIVTLLCYAAALATRSGREALALLWGVLTSAWWRWPVLVAMTVMVGAQMWLFAWAPRHGYGLDASLGYLLLPIALVLVGRLLFREHVSRLQWVAVSIATVAVVVKVALAGTVSWVAFGICIVYAIYFTVRRHAGLDLPATFGAETTLLLPVAVTFVLVTPGASTPLGVVAEIAAGFAGALAMSAYLGASRLLGLPLFGLLSYVEPVLLFVVALLLGEKVHLPDLVVYGLLAVALAILAVDGFRGASRPRE